MRKHRVFWILGVLLIAGAGVSAALYLANKRDLTTSSKAAYDLYRDAELNMKRFYFKEARVGYAKALELDPNFAMAMLGLAQLSPERDQRIALARRAARERDHLTERERYIVDMAKAEADGKPDVSHELALQLHARYPGDYIGANAMARDAMVKGKPDEAMKYYEDLLSVDPNNAEAYNQIGYQYGYRGGQRQPVRLTGREPGLFRPLQRGDRELEPGARHPAGLRARVPASGRGLRGDGRLREGRSELSPVRRARRRFG
jgi:tetratricopeptide (TPR) repeat protein